MAATRNSRIGTKLICMPELGSIPSLTMFVDALPIPSSITLTNVTLTIGAYKINQKMHRDLPATTLYAYGTSSSDARYMLRSSEDQNLTNLFTPGVYEIPLVLKDLQVWSNGSINVPNVGDSPHIHPQWCPEYFGDTILVNGKVWPTFNTTARFYRFRFLNGANARFFNITMSNSSLSFIKIGTDGGYLPYFSSRGVIGCPQTEKSLLIAPPERYDVLVDFSGLAPGSVVYLNNSAVAPFLSGTLDPPQISVMQLRVVPALNPGPSKTDVMNALQLVCNGSSPFTNYTGSLHRKLTLQVQQRHMQITIAYGQTGTCFTGPAIGPAIYQTGLKDTAIVLPDYVTRYGMHFVASDGGPFPFDPTVGLGNLWHCHILDHEDNDMIRPYNVTH